MAALGTIDPAIRALLESQVAAVRESPADADAWGLLGMAFDANGFTAQARQAYTSATALPAGHGRWWYHLGRLRARDGDEAGALAAFDQAIAASPDYVPARWRRGQLLLDRGDLDGADAAFRVAANLAPDDPAGPSGQARVQLARGDHAGAVARLEALVERSPLDRYLYQLLAAGYRGLGRTADAEAASAAGVAGEPSWADPWADEVGASRRGFASALKDATALAAVDRHAEAIAILERLRQQRPDDRELRTYLGGVYASAGRFDDARRLLDETLRASPDDFDATMNLATAFMVSKAYADADRTAARALELRPGNADAIRLRGVAAWRAGHFDDAERWLGESAAANPRDAKALAWIGSIRESRGRHEAALAAYRQALARDPLLPEALVDGAAVAAKAGASADAAHWLARARRITPGHPRLGEIQKTLDARGK